MVHIRHVVILLGVIGPVVANRPPDTGQRCQPGWRFCQEQNICVRVNCADRTKMKRGQCAPGMFRCVEDDSCVKPCDSSSLKNNPTSAQQPAQCGPGTVYCSSSEKCVPLNSCGDMSPGPGDQCAKGYKFCVATGGCVMGECSSSSSADTGRSRHKSYACPDGSEFCAAAGSCVETNTCGSFQIKKSMEGIVCDDDQLFCAARGMCMPRSECGGGRGGTEGDYARSGVICRPNEMFCLSSGRCEPEGECGSRHPNTWGRQCPKGSVYCLESNSCIEMGKTCSGSSPDEGRHHPSSGGGAPPSLSPGGPFCTVPGTTFNEAFGFCVPSNNPLGPLGLPASVSSGVCQDVPRSGPALYTDCLTDQQCFNSTCCADKDTLHLRCVTTTGQYYEQNTNMACVTMKRPDYATGIKATDPKDCPSSSVLCDGECYSIGGKERCPPNSLYCSSLASCQVIGKPCDVRCTPGLLFCPYREMCTAADDCELVEPTSGAPWTMPQVQFVPSSGSYVEASLADIFSDYLSTLNEQDKTKFIESSVKVSTKVGGSVGVPGAAIGQWQVKGLSDWEPVTPGYLFFFKTPLRYVPGDYSMGYFGAAYLTITERPSNIERNVTQLLVPEAPELAVDRVHDSIEVLEDERLLLPLDRIGKVMPLQESYWQAWVQSSVTKDQLTMQNNLIDFASPAAVMFTEIADRPDKMMYEIADERSRTALLAIEVMDQSSQMASLITLALSRDQGQSLEGLPSVAVEVPMPTAETSSGVMVEIVPAPNRSGKVKLELSVRRAGESGTDGPEVGKGAPPAITGKKVAGKRGAEMKGGSKNKGNKSNKNMGENVHGISSSTTIDVEVLPSNDAPVGRALVDLTEVPKISGKEEKWKVEDIASIFFEDDDDETLGLAIYYARPTPIGEWYYQETSESEPVMITDLEKFPLPEPLSFQQGNMGLIDWTRTSMMTKCDTSAVTASSVAALIGNAHCQSAFKLSSDASKAASKARTQRQSSTKAALTADDDVTSQTVINAIFLPPTALLSFRPKSTYGIAEAMVNAKILFAAFDDSDPPVNTLSKAFRREVNIQCTRNSCTTSSADSSSTSQDMSVMVVMWSGGCDNSVMVTSSDAVVQFDICGVCGGDNSTCIDCNNVTGGTAVKVCGECRGGTTGIPMPEKDCRNKPICNDNNICNEKPTTKCDGHENSNAKINKCGECVLGNTGKDENAGIDQCGECSGDESCLGCDGVPDSGFKKDVCNNCKLPSDPTFNDCPGMGNVQPEVADAATPDDVTIKVKLGKQINDDQDCGECKLAPIEGSDAESIPCSSSAVRNSEVVATFSKMSKGQYRLECTFLETPDSSGQQMRSARLEEGPDQNSQPGSLPNGRQGPPLVGKKGAPPNGQRLPPPNGQQGPPPNGQRGPPQNGQQGPPPNGQRGPPPNGQQGSPQNGQQGPPLNGQPGPPPNGLSGQPANGKNEQPNKNGKGKTGKGPKTMTVRASGNPLTVIDSSQGEVKTADTKVKPLDIVSVEFSGHELSDAACCVLRQDRKTKNKGRKMAVALEVTAINTEAMTLQCEIMEAAFVGPAQVCVLQTCQLLAEAQKPNFKMPCTDITIEGDPPLLQSAELSPQGTKLVLTFDVSIAFEGECSDLFANGFPDVGADAQCTARGASLTVMPSSVATIEVEQEIIMAPNNGVTRKSAVSGQPRAIGAATVVQGNQEDNSQDVAFLIMEGDTQTCNGTQVTVKVLPSRGSKIKFKPEDISFNITHELDESTAQSQAETVDVWQSIRLLREDPESKATKAGRGVMRKFKGDFFLPNVPYLIVAKYIGGSSTSNNVMASLSVEKLPSEVSYKVSISGPSTVYIGRTYHFKAQPKPELCGEEKSDRKLQYMWSIAGQSLPEEVSNSPVLKQDTYTLQGGREYRLELFVMERSDPSQIGIGHLIFSTISRGIMAVTSTSQTTVGSANTLLLTARDSQDQDNMAGELAFEWTCMTEAGRGCYVTNAKGEVVLLEELLGEANLNSDKLIIPEGVLPPDQYILSVRVSKDDRSSLKNVSVSVVPGSAPSVFLKSAEKTVLLGERVVLEGSFSAKSGAVAAWTSVQENGFEFYEIQEAPTTTYDDSVFRPYDLLLYNPADDESEPLLGDAAYKFRLTVTDSTGSSFADMVITVNSPPSGGTLEVSPATAQALTTAVTFIASGFIDKIEDYPLTLCFGYSIGDDEKVWYVEHAYDEAPTAIVYLVGDGSSSVQITPVLKICDSSHSCVVIRGSQITVNKPASYSVEAITAITTGVLEKSRSSTTLVLAVNELSLVKRYVKEAAVNDDKVKVAVEMMTTEVLSQVKALAQSMSITKDYASELMEALALMCDQEDTLRMLESIELVLESVTAINSGGQGSAKGAVKGKYERDDKALKFPKTDQQLDVARNGGKMEAKRLSKANTKSISRTKRNVEATVTYSPHTVTEVSTQVMLQEAVIGSVSATQGQKTEKMDALVANVDEYAAGLCMSAVDKEYKTVVGDYIALSVYRSQFKNDIDSKYLIGIGNYKGDTKFIANPNKVVFGPTLEQYKVWQCGMVTDLGSSDCYGACLAMTQYRSLFAAPFVRASIPGILRSPMVRTAVLNHFNGQELQVSPTSTPMEYFMQLDPFEMKADKKLKCFFWRQNNWDGKACRTVPETFSESAGGSSLEYQICQCPTTGYVAVFEISTLLTTGGKDGSTSSGVGPDIYKVRYVKFIIYEDYDKLVLGKEETFTETIIAQVSTLLNVSREYIQNVTVTPGSIEVSMAIVKDPSVTRTATANVADVDVLFEQLNQMLESGQLTLYAPGATEAMNIPPQRADGSGSTHKAEKNLTPIIIGGVVAGIMVIGIIVIIVAIYFKTKKQRDKVSPIQNASGGNFAPSYGSIHFAQSLDNTAVSLAKQQSPQYGELDMVTTYADEDMLIEHRTKSSDGHRSASSSAKDGSRGSSGLGTLNEDAEVPAPFDYKTPTPEDMDRTQEIPPHIQSMLERGEVPAPKGSRPNSS